MPDVPKMTKPTMRVLQFLLAHADEQHHGFALMRETDVGSGTLYPLLDRLKKLGWLVDEEEPKNEDNPGRPPRRFYSLTALGQTAATEALERKERKVGAHVGGPVIA